MAMNPEDQFLQLRTRRQLFRDCGVGVGKIKVYSAQKGAFIMTDKVQKTDEEWQKSLT